MNQANESAVRIVKDYLDRLERQPIPIWPSVDFAQYSYTKSAVKDILERLKDDTKTPPLIIIEEYRELMDKYACSTKPGTSFIFSAGYDVCEDIINELIKVYD